MPSGLRVDARSESSAESEEPSVDLELKSDTISEAFPDPEDAVRERFDDDDAGTSGSGGGTELGIRIFGLSGRSGNSVLR